MDILFVLILCRLKCRIYVPYLMHYRSTNPHFGVFLPPVAFVGDPMQSPVAVRLQVNQVPLILRLIQCWLYLPFNVFSPPSCRGSGCNGGVRCFHQRLLFVQRQLTPISPNVSAFSA
jgi:hypothetical protein